MALSSIWGCWPSEALRGDSANIVMMTADRKSAASFEDLALPQITPLYNHARWLVQDPVEAEDLVQETLTKALRAFDSFERGTNFKAWVFRILRNTFLTSRTALSYARTEFLDDRPDEFEAADGGPTPEEIVLRLHDQANVQRALEELAPPLREVILLCDMEELKYKEIAAILGIPIGTVMSRLARARQALRQSLTDKSGEKR